MRSHQYDNRLDGVNLNFFCGLNSLGQINDLNSTTMCSFFF